MGGRSSILDPISLFMTMAAGIARNGDEGDVSEHQKLFANI